MGELHMLSDAIRFATSAHEGQVDGAGEPYILHPLRVMLACADEQERIAAVLLDTVQGCAGVSLAAIQRRFGEPILHAVDALTRREGEAEAAFLDRCAANGIARAVKIADLREQLDRETDGNRRDRAAKALAHLSGATA